MARKKMVTVAVGDLHAVVVGTLKDFTEKRLKANSPAYRKQAERRVFGSMSEVLGMTPPTSMREALGLA